MYSILRSAITGILLPVSFAVILLQPGPQKDSVFVETDYPENPVITSTQKAFSLRPNAFEENAGQMLNEDGEVDHAIRFRYSGAGNTTIFLLKKGLAYQFKQPVYPEGYLELRSKKHLDEAEQFEYDALKKEVYVQTYQMSIMLEGASENATITKEKPLSATAKYYQHNNEQQAGYYEKVTYQDVYPGIDWVIYTTEHGIKYDFELAPGADPSLIKLRILDAESIRIDKTGSLILTNRLGSITENTPVSFQDGIAISTQFILDSNLLQFNPGNYDRSKPLTIDPTIIWSTYFGGTENDWAHGTVVDGSGNVYIAGTTSSSSGIASGGFDNSLSAGSTDAYLAKFNSNGVLQWATYYGSVGDEEGYSCAIDGSNNVYLAGTTTTTSGIGSGGHQTTHGGQKDAFLVKFNSSGTRQWATYYGGNEHDEGNSCSTDGSGNVYLGGSTSSTSGIATAGSHGPTGGTNVAFLVKFNSSGTRQWGTYYGYFFASTANTRINALCTDALGNVFAAGTTSQAEAVAIANGGHDNSFSGAGTDAFMVKFNSSGVRQWGTYYGYNDGTTNGNACATDASNNVYLLGGTRATRFMATTGSHQPAHASSGSNNDAILAKFDASGNRLWATYYGGTAFDVGYALAIDNSDNVYMAGVTGSGSGIADGGHQNTIGGDSDAFLAKINSSGVRQWATYFGGTASEWGFGCATGSANNVYLAGYSESTSGIADGGHQNTKSVGEDGFLAKFRSIAIGLPVQLTRFEGQCIGTGAELSWNTATEINNRKFVVERSENQQIWSVAGEVAGAGNSTQPRQYQFRDEKAGLSSLRFYRLKQVDFDGKTTLSPVVKVQCNATADNVLRVYPNPANEGKVFVKGWTEAGRYFLVNAMGQVAKSGQLQGDLPAIDVNGLAPGTYFLSIEGKTQKLREKIILR